MTAPRTAVMANAGSALVVDHLFVRRGDSVVVDDVSLDVKPLELHELVRPRGAIGRKTCRERV